MFMHDCLAPIYFKVVVLLYINCDSPDMLISQITGLMGLHCRMVLLMLTERDQVMENISEHQWMSLEKQSANDKW